MAMDQDHANRIPIPRILARLARQPNRIGQHKAVYQAPWRKNKRARLWVYLNTNRWYDYDAAIGGDLLDLVCYYLKSCQESHTPVDALRWLENMVGDDTAPGLFLAMIDATVNDEGEESTLVLRDLKSIQDVGLIHYLSKAGIEVDLARKYLKELRIYNPKTGRKFVALGLKNEQSGFNLSNPFIKGCLGPLAITFIRGQKPKPAGIHVFADVLDYLSALSQLKGTAFRNDTIVLNSLSCLKQIIPYIQHYGYQVAYSWMTNDPAGRNATAALDAFLTTQAAVRHQPMNKRYAPHQTVHAWHIHHLTS
jgi:hypothetical protein